MEWIVALGLVILPLVVLAASVYSWLDRLAVAESLAHEAGRAMAVAPDWESGLNVVAALEQTAEAELQAGPRSCPGPRGCLETTLSGGPARGELVHVEVSVWVPGFVVPPFGELRGFWLSAGHDEVVDPYRSLPVPAAP